jgi:hypothetical protein
MDLKMAIKGHQEQFHAHKFNDLGRSNLPKLIPGERK